jgi:hypothetical protein
VCRHPFVFCGWLVDRSAYFAMQSRKPPVSPESFNCGVARAQTPRFGALRTSRLITAYDTSHTVPVTSQHRRE